MPSSEVRALPTQPRARVTRAKVLDAAEGLFRTGGYENTSVSDVARRAGVGVGTVYHHFPDKRAILLELIDRWGDRLASQRRRDLDLERFLADDPRGGITRWLESTYERIARKGSIYLVVVALADRDDEVRRRYRRIEQVAVERLTAIIEFGQRRGTMRASLDPQAAGFVVHHSLDMAVSQLLIRDQPADRAARVLRELADMICRYLLEE